MQAFRARRIEWQVLMRTTVFEVILVLNRNLRQLRIVVIPVYHFGFHWLELVLSLLLLLLLLRKEVIISLEIIIVVAASVEQFGFIVSRE